MTATQPWTPIPPTTPARQGNAPATAGFVLGLVGLLAGWVPVVGLLVTVSALLLSRAGRARFRDGHAGSAGRSGAGLVLGWIGTAICVLMTVFMIAAPRTPEPAAVVQPVPAPAPAAPVLLAVPNVVGMADAQAREVLATAGFTNVVLGPSTGSIAGVAAGTVTAQLPGAAAQASAGDPITLGEADAPPVPAAAPAPAPAVVEEPVADAPRVDAPRPLVASPRAAAPAPAAAAPAAPAPASSGSSAYYANCSAARAAGAAPLYRGEAGYRSGLDRDGDGVACES
ncbi:excalibur calcium-binding domain-containing protein [Pseudonocardia kujensis]|uniref:excalibur calcium-binding domain-containing protein n=1 Tax=Pseudonocardia kujensis TaxID=1128675 RepID=UPI001E31B896|nr:excalibur calcium-binding domain-containing protein [Pseudonocardia kujensis]MCE0768359.1 excalibur calcium-binding domain-containing protein [Pseudonocardia kujensis]